MGTGQNNRARIQRRGIVRTCFGKPDGHIFHAQEECDMDMAMKRQDLLELYQLLWMYRHTYHPEERLGVAGWMDQVGERYACVTGGSDVRDGRNPRMAGRKRVYTEDENERIRERRRDGKSLREIAREAGCSLGHVQDVLRNG